MHGQLHNTMYGVEVNGQRQFTNFGLCWCNKNKNHWIINPSS